jgi:UDP-glucose 4-epimerase
MGHKIAIVGGAGFLGLSLYDHLLKQGLVVWIVGRHVPLNLMQREFRLSLPSLSDAISGATVVVHFASTSTPATSALNPKLDIENIEFTLDLAQACINQRISHFIYASSGGTVYGDCSHPVDEQFPTNPMGSYAIAKIACEQYLKVLLGPADICVSILRISNPYGGFQITKNGQGVVSYLTEQVREKKIITLFGDSVRDYIYVLDVLTAVSCVIEKPHKFEIFNIATGVGTSLLDLVTIISETLNLSARVELKDFRSFDLKYNVLNNSKAIRLLAWEPLYDIKRGIAYHLSDFAN